MWASYCKWGLVEEKKVVYTFREDTRRTVVLDQCSDSRFVCTRGRPSNVRRPPLSPLSLFVYNFYLYLYSHLILTTLPPFIIFVRIKLDSGVTGTKLVLDFRNSFNLTASRPPFHQSPSPLTCSTQGSRLSRVIRDS